MASPVRYTASAQQFILEELGYLDAKSEPAADRFRAMLEAAEARLAQYPQIGPATRVRGVRRLVLAPYIFTYRRLADAIEVVSIRHGRQRDPAEETPATTDEDC